MKEVNQEWCENFIKSRFSPKHHAFAGKPDAGIEVGLFWREAELAGLYEKGTYDTPMSHALEKLCDVVHITDEEGNYYYSVFRMRRI